MNIQEEGHHVMARQVLALTRDPKWNHANDWQEVFLELSSLGGPEAADIVADIVGGPEAARVWSPACVYQEFVFLGTA